MAYLGGIAARRKDFFCPAVYTPPPIPHGFHPFRRILMESLWIPWIPRGPLGSMTMDSMDSLWSPWIPFVFPCDSHGASWCPPGIHGFHMDSTWIGTCICVRKFDAFTWLLEGFVCGFSPQFILVEIQPQIQV